MNIINLSYKILTYCIRYILYIMNQNLETIIEPFKVIILNSLGEPKNVVIFHSSPQGSPDSLQDFFSETEKNYLEKFNVDIKTSEQLLHSDDSMRTLKRKILKELNFSNNSYEEVYMFSKKDYKINFPKHFHYLKKENSGLNRHQLGQLIMNLHLLDKEEQIKNLQNDPSKKLFSYYDIESELKLDQNTFEITNPIGHKFDSHDNLLFPGNPFDFLPNSESVFLNDNENLFLTFENSLILNYKNIKNQCIFLCFADDVLEYAVNNNLNEKNMIQYYYPFLFQKNILSLSQLKNEQFNLIEESKKKLESVSDEQIDTFYKVSSNEIKVPYIKKGIYDVVLTLYPDVKIQMPLENIFKQLHCTKEIPFIKYKPGFKKEELYRLYSTGFSTNGSKIPYLSKSQITNFSKYSVSSSTYVTIVVQKSLELENVNIFYSLSQNGNIQISIHFSNPMSKSFIESLIIDSINPFIIEINSFLQNNNKISLLNNLDSNLIEVNKINYVNLISTNQALKNTDYKILIPIFNIIEIGKNVTSLRYKRVDNYTEMNELNAQINKMYKQNNSIQSIVNLITINFGISEDEAFDNVKKYLDDCTKINGNFMNKKMDIADNPGFTTLLNYNDVENMLKFEIYDINSFQYIQVIETYIDAFVKLALYKKDLSIQQSEIDILKKELNKSKKDEDTSNLVITQENLLLTKPVEVDKEKVTEFVGEIEDENEDDNEDEDGILFLDEDDEAEEEEFESVEEKKQENKIMLDEDDEEDDDEGGLLSGGLKTDKGTGTIFFNKLKKLEPTIFVNETDSAYAKICPSQSNRQPVILTPEEKEEIDNDENAKNAYGVSLKYGSDPNKPYYYICPRYWCLKTNKPMTEEQVKNGECGGKIIPTNKKTNIPEGYYIYEFTDDRQHLDGDGNYIHYNPGFLDKSKSKNNIGVPCCFKNPFGAKQNQRRQELNLTDDAISYGNKDLIVGEKAEKSVIVRNYSNILSIERIPIPQHRWGFIPISIELFLQIDNSKSLDPANPAYIKKNASPLLRYGVEKSTKKSFIACIADLYTFHNNISVPSIDDMMNIIVEKISLDNFTKLHNGNLVSLFQPDKINISDIQVEKYSNTNFYKSINLNDKNQYTLLKFTISSYENFIQYLQDEDSIIDHTFLWDAVSSPLIGLFKDGINLIIMEVENNDRRDNVTLLCPTNAYSDFMFDDKKGSVLILKQNEFYEPLYIYGNTKNEKSSSKTNAIKIFYRENTPASMNFVFKNIKDSINSYCQPKHKNKNFKYVDNISASKLYELTKTINLNVSKQILNYRNQIIGLIVSQTDESKQLFLPCKPSAKLNDIEVDYIDNVEWLDYSSTVSMLTSISSKSNKQILSLPIAKLEEDGLIVGIITETNQFISISDPQQNLESDDLKTVQTYSYQDYYLIDKQINISDEIDKERYTVTRNIKLETKFYLQFRHKLKDEIMNLMNKDVIDQLELICKSKDYTYQVKLMKVKDIIQNLLSYIVRFVDFNDDVLDILFKKNTMDPNNEHGICLHSNNMLCIPKNNLINDNDNEETYFIRLADEIIRNKRIQNYMFNPFYMKIVNIDYSIYNDEMLILNSHLTEDFFNLKNTEIDNKYISKIPYDTAISSDNKNNTVVSVENQTFRDKYFSYDSIKTECIEKTQPLSKKNNIKNIFGSESNEIVLYNSPLCSYFVLMYALKVINNSTEDLISIKRTLVNAYNKLLANSVYSKVIETILSKQTKKDYINKIKKKQLSFESMIMNEKYIMTQFDLWVFCNYKNLPIVIFTPESYKSFQVETNFIILGGDIDNDNYIFIKSNPIKQKDTTPSSFSIIEPQMKLSEIDNVVMNRTSLEDYLSNYKFPLNIKK